MDEIRRSRKDDRAGLHKAQTTLHGLTAFCVTTIKINLRVSDMSESLICLPLTHPPPSTLLSPLHPFLPPPLSFSSGQPQRSRHRSDSTGARHADRLPGNSSKRSPCVHACVSVAHMFVRVCVRVCTCESVNH